MDLVPSSYQSGSEPEVLTLRFPDVASQGANPRANAYGGHPRRAWEQLAEEKASELGIEYRVQRTEGRLDVAFKSADDCSALVAAMQPEWHDRLMAGIQNEIQGMPLFRDMAANAKDPERHATTPNQFSEDAAARLAEFYDLDEAELRQMIGDTSPVL